MNILIAAKTHMRNGCCVGAYCLVDGANLRLLTAMGDKLPEDIEYQVGDIWDIEHRVRPDIIKPHVEDVMVQSKKFIRRQDHVGAFFKANAPIWNGGPCSIFEDKVTFPHGQSCYIDGRKGLPSRSVGFWLPDKTLELTILDDHRHYYYFGEDQIYVLPYVGYAPVVDAIPRGVLVRVSLTRWWTPSLHKQDKRCYCQISGWYDE